MKYFILILLILSGSFTNAQKNENDFSPKNLTTKFISFSTNNIQKINTSFSIRDVEVIDASYNKSVLGFIKNMGVSGFLKIMLKEKNEIESYLAAHLPVTGSDTASVLLCIFKKLLLSDNIYIADDKNKSNNLKDNVSINSGVMITVEFFLHKDEFSIPLYRFDSTLLGNATIGWGASDYLAAALTSSLVKMGEFSWSSVFVGRRKIRQSLIDSTITGHSTAPILSNTPVKGVYKSFVEFKNNKPSITEYTVTKTEKADFIYTKNENNTEILRTDIWGYSDGAEIFVYSAENLFMLYPIEKTFAVYGAKDYTRVRRIRISAGTLDLIMPNSALAKSKTRSKFVLKQTLLIVDMEDGELY